MENENKDLTTAEEETLEGPAVVEKINLNEIQQEQVKQKQEEEKGIIDNYIEQCTQFLDTLKHTNKDDLSSLFAYILEQDIRASGDKESIALLDQIKSLNKEQLHILAEKLKNKK